jgi:hypothetical protein
MGCPTFFSASHLINIGPNARWAEQLLEPDWLLNHPPFLVQLQYHIRPRSKGPQTHKIFIHKNLIITHPAIHIFSKNDNIHDNRLLLEKISYGISPSETRKNDSFRGCQKALLNMEQK